MYWINRELKDLDPEYEKNVLDEDGNINYSKFFAYILQSEWESYFSEETLRLFGSLVLHLSEEKYGDSEVDI